jgi:hypothetical protein
MKTNKLIHLSENLSRKEMTRFREFALSPYFNKHEAVQALVVYLSGIYPDFNDRNCHREVIFKEIFPGQEHDQSRLAVIFTYTFRLLEQFLIQERFEEQIPLHNILLLKELRLRKHYVHYEKALHKAEAELEQSAGRDSEYFNLQYQLATEAEQYNIQIGRGRKDVSLQRRQKNLDNFYLAEKLKDACEMRVRAKIMKVDYVPKLLGSILREIEENLEEYAKTPAVFMYFRIYLMLTDPDSRFFFEALEILRQKERFFGKAELVEIYNYFQNYCIERINKGEELFLGEIFKLYQSQLEQDLMIEDGYLSEWHYKNIVTTGIRLREMEWVERFIERYREKLRPEVMSNAYRFNLASFHYAARRYDKVLDLLTRVEYSDLRYNLGAKALLLRTYYDLGEYDALHSLTESLKQYLHRNKLMADFRREGYANLFRLTRRAALLKANFPFYSDRKIKQELARLNKNLAEASTVFNKGWLLEKVRELGGSSSRQ